MSLHRHHRFMISYTRRFLKSLRRPVLAYLVTWSFTLILVGSSLFHFCEFGSNQHLSDFFDSVYYSVTIMTGVGLGDIVPVTKAGKFVSMLMMLSGTAIFVSFTAVISASILETEAEESRD